MSVTVICIYMDMADRSTISAASEALLDGVRPPTAWEPAPPSDVAGRHLYRALRPTAARRPAIRPVVWPEGDARAGFATNDPYVRRFWTAAIGPGAVADLMRLAVAAQRDRSLLRPEALRTLVREDLARWVRGRLLVRVKIPTLSPFQLRRLSPELRREHHPYTDRLAANA